MASVTQQDFHIPTVDIEPFLKDPESKEGIAVVDAVRLAVTTSGFFQLVGHGISSQLRKAVFAGSKAFFNIPFNEKQKVKRGFNRGYETLGAQALQYGTLPDMKEGFYIGEDTPEESGQHRRFMEPNVWPSEDLLSYSVFKFPMNEYYNKVQALSATVMSILARALPYTHDVLDHFSRDPVMASMRLLHYPPQSTTDQNQLGAGAHTDFGVITLLLTDGSPGLQVLNNASGEWVPVPPNADAYVVNMGDMMDQITGGHFKSNTHRVINTGNTHRYSIPYFFDGNLDTRLTRLDGKNQGPVLTVEEHMAERFATTYGRVKPGTSTNA
ncbi:citrinin biosynthesis oxygenase CtnA [Saccharata proteae CBS 121410]|uniref:Citrinin biosynthesis oxygenase CtnA n=1 Tax=Saccharata proteae CBS 121410 TaxID=1314787 RepID=A0A9P4I0R6_9PEZI|nr:citrinin biosynthesis oxygenase CtnA [Saccharata proteae CBS 121410]